MNPAQALTATLDELRDWLAGEDGWVDHTTCPDGWDSRPWKNHTTKASSQDHPHPPTLDGAAKALPEGWEWSRANGVWHGWHDLCTKACGCVEPSTDDTGDEIADRYRLAVLCRIAAKEASK